MYKEIYGKWKKKKEKKEECPDLNSNTNPEKNTRPETFNEQTQEIENTATPRTQTPQCS